MLVQLDTTCRRPHQPRNTQGRVSFDQLGFGEQPEVFPGDLDRLLGQPRVFIAPQDYLGHVPRSTVTRRSRNVEATEPPLWNRQMNVQCVLIARPMLVERLGCWCCIREWNLEWKSVGKDAGSRSQREQTAGEHFMIDLQSAESPWAEHE